MKDDGKVKIVCGDGKRLDTGTDEVNMAFYGRKPNKALYLAGIALIVAIAMVIATI